MEMGVGMGVLSERARMFVGLDLGQSRDPSALSVVERAEVFPGEMDWVTYERRRLLRFRVLYLERVLLGTPYPRVVERVRQVVRRSAPAGQMRAGDGCHRTGNAGAGHAAGRKPGVRNCAGAADGRGAGVLRERGLARAEARPDYRPASDAG